MSPARPRTIDVEATLEGWVAIAAEAGFSERTARRRLRDYVERAPHGRYGRPWILRSRLKAWLDKQASRGERAHELDAADCR